MITHASVRIGISLLAVLVTTALAANAVPREYGGVLHVINPSVVGLQQGERPPVTVLHDGVATVDVGTPAGTAYTSVGNSVMIPTDAFRASGGDFRYFVGFPQVAQLTNTFFSPQPAATLAAGAGAAAVSSQTLCPPRTGVAGGWDACTVWSIPNNPTASPASNNHVARIHIEKAGNMNAFGGVLSILRNVSSDVWFLLPPYPVAPFTGDAAIASRQERPLVNEAWPGGQPNGFAFSEFAFKGYRYQVTLDGQGKINAFTGALGPACTQPPNSGMTVSGRCQLPRIQPSANPPARQWGWQMTTGLVTGSDDNPPNSTPMAPSFFFFASTGDDTTVMTSGGATQRNIVLVGGGVAHSPAANQTFHRNTTLRLTIPEPAAALGMAAGVAVLVALGLARRRN